MTRIGRLETALLLIGILLVGAYFRFVGLGWGEGQPIHPDEEFLRQVVAAVELPDRPALYFDTANSSLNPYNRGQGFFVYGTLPLFLTRAAAEGLDRGCQVPYGVPARLLSPLLLGRPVDACWPGAFTGAGARMVGRALAALFDLASVVCVFLAGRRLFSRWGGLLASLLYGLAVLPIQQAHFFTVDAFASFFAAITLYLAVRAAQTGGWGTFLLAGLATGLGMACKISLWPLGLLVALAAACWGWGGRAGRPYAGMLARVAVAGAVALLAFRTAQPYAFLGPGFFGVRPNPQWLDNMAQIRGQMSGTVDLYHGHQWASRAPLVFPWINMVVWGLGLPLGLVAWAGWGLAAADLFRRWRQRRALSAVLLPWAWGTVYFLYQGTQWVKSIRYLLPVYPAFVLLAAWMVGRLVGGEPGQESRARWRRYGMAAGIVAVGGALCWALAISSVYVRPHTRIAASRWIFDNVPTAATVHLDTRGESANVPVVLPPGTVLGEAAPATASFRVARASELTGVTLNYVVDPLGDAASEVVRVAVAADAAGHRVLAETTAVVAPPSSRPGQVYTFPLGPVQLSPDDTYYVIATVLSDGPLHLFTSVLATEHWDWPPPLRVDGYDPFGGMYASLSTSSDGTLQLYHDDTPEKRESLLEWLDETDFIITASNRLYASIPRLSSRYPLTVAYYRALFNGELGFELAADFTSYLALGPLQFPDQEEPFAVPSATYRYRAAPVSVPVPSAEEAFSVYDHPRVLVFRKTPTFSRERAEKVLPASLLDDVVWVTARQATRGVGDSVLDPETWAQQQAGGTWSEMFDRQSPLNRSPWLAALVWYAAVAVLGWMAFPLLYVALPRLSERGYGLARAVGLLVVGYFTWLAASLRVLPNTRATVAIAVVVLALAGGVAAWRSWRGLRDFLRRRWVTIVFSEGLFLALFAIWAWVRALNPDLWHPVVGGEKPMDFAYFNAVIKSTWFPPYDPWFSGGYLNYYYFGFVLIGSLAKLLGIMPSVAYNLALLLFYALTGSAAFSVVFSLVDRGDASPRPYVAGLLAVLLFLVLGNLGEVRLLINGFRLLAGEPTFESTIPGLPELVQTMRGLGLALRGAHLPFRPETPYWDPTRMLPFPAFSEFPAFTFLYGDPHAHMLALPYTITTLALALNWARGAQRLRGGWLVSCAIGALVIGSLVAGNTWDYPTYLLVGLAGLALGMSGLGVAGMAWRGALLAATSLVLFLPYVQSYAPPVGGLELWQGERVSLGIYLLLTGQFLFPLLTLLAVEGRRALRPVWSAGGTAPRVALVLVAGGLLLLGLAGGMVGVAVAAVTIPLGAAAAAAAATAKLSPGRRLVWLLLALGVVLGLAVEVLAVGGDRMNTVFKFHFQAWTFLAIGAAAALTWLSDELRGWSLDARQVWWVLMGLLLAAAALFPVMGIPAKVGDRLTWATGRTLDGMAFMEYSRIWDVRGEVDLGPDYEAIVWMQENIEGSPVILEGLGEREYLWGNRVSIYTGLPTVVGWRWHQVQQRMAGVGGQVEQRQLDVVTCYMTLDTDRAWDVIERYGVRYIYVGPYERLYYTPQGLGKFDEMADQGTLRVIYDREGVRIYEVVGPAAAATPPQVEPLLHERGSG